MVYRFNGLQGGYAQNQEQCPRYTNKPINQ